MVSQAHALSQWLWTTTWQAGAIALLVWGLTTVLRPWLTPGARRALWALVLLRLAMPVLPQSRWSAWGWFDAAPGATAGSDPLASVPEHRAVGWMIERGPLEGSEHPGAGKRTLRVETLSWVSVSILAAWAGGAVLFLVATVGSNVRLCRRLRRAARVADDRVLRVLEECRRRMRVRRAVDVVQFDGHGPALAGVWRPTILLPAGLARRVTREQLRFILLHELAHLKRNDIFVDWLLSVVHAVHWFNPVAWLAVSRLRSERELARDAMVLRVAGGQERGAYGEAILKVVEDLRTATLRFGAVGLLEERGQLRARIAAIATPPRSSVSAMLLAGALVLAVGCSGLTRKPERSASPPPTTQVAVATFDPAPLSAPTTLPAFPREYPPEIQAKLDRRLPQVRFDAVPLFDAIDFFRDLTNSQIFVNWRALEAAGVARDTPVTTRLRDVKFSKALELVLRDAGKGEVLLDYTVDEGVITISTADELNQNVAIQVYDIRDLLSLVPEGDAPAEAEQVKLVTDLIKETVDKKSWTEFGGKVGSIRFLSGQLIITQTPENQRAIAGLLDKLREGRSTQIVFEARFLTVPRDAADQLEVERGAIFDVSRREKHSGKYLDEEAVRALIRSTQQMAGSTVLAAPRVTVFNAQRARVFVGQETVYTAGHGPRGEEGKREPVTEKVMSGISLNLQGVVSADRKYVTTTLHPRVSELIKLREVRWEQAERGERLTVQKPEMRVNEVKTMLAIPEGRTLVAVLPRVEGEGEEDRRLMLLLKPTVVQSRPEQREFPLLNKRTDGK